MNRESTMSYTDRLRDAFQRVDGKKNNVNQADVDQLKHKSKNSNKDAKAEKTDKVKTTQPPSGGLKAEKVAVKPDTGLKVTRHSPSTNDNSHTPRFEVYDNYTLVARHNPSSRPTSSTISKSRSEQLLQAHQPVVTRRPHYGHTASMNIISEAAPKIIRPSSLNPEQNRSMSATYKSQMKPDLSVHKSLSQRQPVLSQTALKTHNRQLSATVKPTNIGNMSTYQNYDSLGRSRSKATTKITESNNEKQLVYYSLTRKPKNPSQNGVKYHSSTKRILSNPLYIDTGNSRRNKISPIKIPRDSVEGTMPNGVDENLINFSQTLARAATNSPPIKRRSSSLLHSPNPRTNSRFATRSTIDEIYTQKNRKDNYEKYKKVANEILKENLALKFGENYPFPNLVRDISPHSSSSSLSSTSLATDQQNSISSIPPDDIPLNIPNKDENTQESNELFHPQKSTDTVISKVDTEDDTEIPKVTMERLEIAEEVFLSDDDNEGSEEYDLDNEHSSSESYASDSDGDIEQIKKKFVPLHEIERMDDDFTLENELQQLPDHQHSQSFRIENTSLGSIVEVFVHKESLQRAKKALTTVPSQGILSKRPIEEMGKKKRRALFDPHILLLDACLEPDYELVKELVPKISDISRSTIDGITALHNAVCSADSKLVLFLIQSGANVNASDADGWTPLHCAACCNNRQISKILVENGASLFAVTLSDYEIPSQKCNKTNQEDTQCEEYLFYEQENVGVANGGIVYSLFEYSPPRTDELSLFPNQILKVLNTNPPGETGWFHAEDISEIVSVPKRGYVAAAYVSCYPLILLKHK